MEMDSMHLDNSIECTEDESKEQLLSPYSADMADIFGAPQVLPRVGHQYQAEIPHLISKHNSLELINEPADTKILVNLPYCCSLELPIPLMWANTEFENVSGTVEFEKSEESQITSTDDSAEPKVEALHSTLGSGKDAIRYLNSHSTLENDQMEVLMQEKKTKLDKVEKGLCPLPDSVRESWKQIEYDSFLLGLYIFEKNLNLVKRFVESKGMGDILSFYYGKFYGSDAYHRWSECRKLRSRCFVYGQRIFTGWRQQELLLRLFSHVSEECKNVLLEDCRKFGEGKISFEEFVFTLKDDVGINMLIEAIGVGKGKKDLTSTAMDPIKTNHMCSLQPKIPVGKACSSLTSAEITRFLTGSFRLSKTRSSDLFWEAVWPRLLAKGWHSEQPKDHSFSNSKNALVFLTSGVKKFSRRRLVKGDHYYDSVSDVLNKVASEPGLLELEIETGKGSEHKEEVKLDQPMKKESDGLSNKQLHCYLQPRKFNHNQHLMQFTIVDTSLFHGERRSSVRKLISLPVESMNMSTSSNLSSESEEDTSEDSEDKEEEETNTTNVDGITNKETCADSSDCARSILNNSLSNTPTSINVAVENRAKHSTSPVDDKQQKEDLMAGMHEESSCNFENVCVDQKLDERESICKSNLHNAGEDMVSQLGSHQNLSSTSSLAKGNSDRRNEVNVSENCLDREVSSRRLQFCTLIDLDVPQVSSESGHDEPSKDMVRNNDSSSEKKLRVTFEPKQVEESKIVDGKSSIDQQPVMKNRRQSTRNRPLTIKALEAFAFGFLSPKRKRKDTEASQKNTMSKASRRVHSKTVGGGAVKNGVGNIEDSRIEGSLDALCGNTNLVDESHV